MKRFSLWVICPMLFLFVMLQAQSEPPNGTRHVAEGPNGNRIVSIDSTNNGNFDYIAVYNRDGVIIEERMDYNDDGIMDDFYFYRNSVLVRREIDSTFDGNIDVWVYIREGVYIERYEMDTNGDGTADVVKDYR